MWHICKVAQRKQVAPYVDHDVSTRPAKPIAESALSQSPLAQNVPAQSQSNRRPRHPKQGQAVKEKSTRAFKDEEDSRRGCSCGRSLRDSFTPRYGSWKQRKEWAISEAVHSIQSGSCQPTRYTRDITGYVLICCSHTITGQTKQQRHNRLCMNLFFTYTITGQTRQQRHNRLCTKP